MGRNRQKHTEDEIPGKCPFCVSTTRNVCLNKESHPEKFSYYCCATCALRSGGVKDKDELLDATKRCAGVCPLCMLGEAVKVAAVDGEGSANGKKRARRVRFDGTMSDTCVVRAIVVCSSLLCRCITPFVMNAVRA